MHRAYNQAVENLLQQTEESSGVDRNSWSLPQWKAVANEILSSTDAAIKDFLDKLEANNPGARGALGTAVSTYQVSTWRLVGRALGILASNVGSNLTLVLFIDTRPYTDPVYRSKQDPEAGRAAPHERCLHSRDTGGCVY
jgi:hypothetical protein